MNNTVNGEDFRSLTEPLRRELVVHCYRMLGSLQDAEDAVQETLVRAWSAYGSFEGRSSLRTWLYRIATHQCLNARRAASRRPAKAWDVPLVEPPTPTRWGDLPWLEPMPDALVDDASQPDARYTQRESISLAFVTALQRLPARQLAVLVLRDVVGFEAREVASIMTCSVDAANAMLKRARAAMEVSTTPARSSCAPSEIEAALLRQFVAAWESADVPRLVALLTDDVSMSMPPIPFEYEGRDAVQAFCESVFRAGRRFTLVATRANGQPAFAAYLRSNAREHPAVGLYVLALRGDRISALVRFEASVLRRFGVAPALVATRSPTV